MRNNLAIDSYHRSETYEKRMYTLDKRKKYMFTFF